jgi:hypothetical protein
MRARHHTRKMHGEACRARGGGVSHHPAPCNVIKGEGNAPKLHAGKRARGGGNWIKGAIKHPGALHRSLGVPEGQKIPAKKLAKAAHSSNPTTRRRVALAKTLKHMHH